MTILTLLNPFGWFGTSRAKLSGGNQPGQYGPGLVEGSAAGQAVTPETALSLSAYWACVKLIGQTIGTLPLELFHQRADGARTLAIDHPLFDLLHDQPNAEHSAVEFWEGIGACLAVWGNAYALKQKLGNRIVALEPLRPFWMSVFRNGDGDPVYRYNDPKGRVDYAAEDLLHVRGFGFADLVGLSAIAFARQPVGTALAAQEASGSVFRNGMRPSGWFKFKGGTGILTADQTRQAKERLVDPFTGAGNAAKVGILPGDFDWIGTNINPTDVALIETMRFGVEEVCRGFGVPPVMVGHAGPGQTMWGSGVEQIVLGFLTTGLRPYLHRIEAAIGRDIIGRAERKVVRCAFNVDELLRGDNKGRAAVDQSLANTGIATRNEIRAGRGLRPMPGGDTLTVQSALIPIDMLGTIVNPPRDKSVSSGSDDKSEPF